MKKIILLAGVAALTASCSSFDAYVDSPEYKKLKVDEYQIAGHPYKSAKDCTRKAPIGKFDAKCDIPVVGLRNFTNPSFGISAGGIGGGPAGGVM